MKLASLIFCTFLAGFISSCSTASKNASEDSRLTYTQLIEQSSDSKIFYDGLQNSIDVKTTFLSQPVSSQQQNVLAEVYQWPTEKKLSEGEKEKTLLEQESRFFISIYTPEKKYDDLDKNKTLWRVFLEVDGKQWEAKIKKLKLLDAEIKNLYPYFTPYSTAYIASFAIPTKSLELHPFSLKITGPIAQASFFSIK